MHDGCSAADITEYNKLDAIRTKGILLADKKCRNFAWEKIKAWQLIIRKYMGAKIDLRYLHRVLRAADITDISLTTEQDARENLNAVQRNYKNLKRNAAAFSGFGHLIVVTEEICVICEGSEWNFRPVVAVPVTH
jgi:hypothetical protein